ncbi:hypothetical protein F5148DRAFT_1150965 [Russula earlei]|uniref:Uncharacterized protein n=1 Tax=Russula earlei TaxID=71964 RepID=A0ACC0U4C7_9AGAM|nr:hypothetical protein F5148DRAFT_1150965 [Russula earlei]
MSQNNQTSCEERVFGEKPIHEQDEDYDLFHFWPSLNNRDVSSLYGPVSLRYSYSYSESNSRPQSPITFAPMVNHWPSPPQPPPQPETSVNFGLKIAHRLDRGIKGVKSKLRKPKL